KGANKELDYLRFKCLDGSLEISTKDNVLVNEYFKFELVNGSLNHLILNGDQKVDVTELSAKHFEITVNGIGKASLTGQVAFFNASLNGLAELDAANLKSEDGRVEVNGAGIAKLNVSSELNARVNGSGSVEYLGTPVNLKTEVNGSGSITSVP
ncbi:GIN domain-containing protein, partial [Vibrio cholerae]